MVFSTQTIFEIGSTSKTCCQDVMKLKRRKHGTVIDKVKLEQANKTHSEGDNVEKTDTMTREDTIADDIKVWN